MLQLSESLLNQPVLSLRANAPVAKTLQPIINPNNLKIEGFYVQDNRDRRQLILLDQDIRDLIAEGFVINDHDVLVEPADLVRLQAILKINFTPIGKQVVTASKHKIGKVVDFATEIDSMFIQKIYVTQSFIKSFSGGNLGIDRTQIIEITDTTIVVNDLHGTVPIGAKAIA